MNRQAFLKDTLGARESRTGDVDVLAILRRSAFLDGMEDAVLEALSACTEAMSVAAGQEIIRRGDPGSTMFFIVDGEVRVHHGETILAVLGDGDVFGEMALLDSEQRSASVSALADTRLLCLERDAFYGALWQHPRSFKPLIAAIIRRERKIVSDVTERTRALMAYQKELEIGRKIQSSFLPESLPDIPGWEVATTFEAAREVAGDFYDVFHLDGNHYALVLGDVCGKGVGAALFMTLFRSLLRSACIQEFLAIGHSPAPANAVDEALRVSVETTNVYVAQTHATSTMFTTLFFGILDAGCGRLHYVNAGHEAPLLFRSDGEVERLEPTGGVIGLFDVASYRVETVDLLPGDLVLVYSDGVSEARNPDDDQFGTEEILQAALAGPLTAGEVVERLAGRVTEFRGAAEQSDDITLVAAACCPAREEPGAPPSIQRPL